MQLKAAWYRDIWCGWIVLCRYFAIKVDMLRWVVGFELYGRDVIICLGPISFVIYLDGDQDNTADG